MSTKRCVCGIEISKGKKCEDCKNGSHGLKWTEMLKISNAQDNKCPILGTPFIIDLENKKIIDGDPKSKKKQRVCVDHDHDTMVIRGLLSDMGNMLVGGYDRERYGICDRPTRIINYLDARIARQVLGEERKFI
jgi:hypothetical protein